MLKMPKRYDRKVKKMKKKYDELAAKILDEIGGKDNVINVFHCVTRLRFNLKDESIPDTDEIKKLQGVLGVNISGGQYQIIIGQDVSKLYKKVIEIGDFENQDAIDETLDEIKPKLNVKRIFSYFFDYMSGVMSPMIPAYAAAGLFKTIAVMFGPDLFGIWSITDDLYLLFDFAYNACFYFLPIYLGYTAAKKLGVNVILGMYVGGIMLVPGFVEIATTHESFTVLGIPCILGTYGNTIFPIILSVFALKYVDKLFDKIIPQVLSTSFKPFLELLVMLPLALCLFCPIGTLIGEGIAQLILMLNNAPIITGIVGGLWPFLILTGMHMPILYAVMLPNLYSVGYDTTLMAATALTNPALLGMTLAALLRIKNKQERNNIFGMFIAHNVGGISEPVLYGIGIKYKKPLIGLAIGGICGGLFVTFTHVVYYLGPNIPFIYTSLSFFQGGTMNFILYLIGAIIAFGVTFVITYLYGFDKNDLILKEEK